MNLIRLILFLLAAWLIYKLFFAGLLSKKPSRTKGDTHSDKTPKNMVQCQQCQLHIPREEALAEKKLWFCCEEHKQQYLNDKERQS